jgi:hypothetical protein
MLASADSAARAAGFAENLRDEASQVTGERKIVSMTSVAGPNDIPVRIQSLRDRNRADFLADARMHRSEYETAAIKSQERLLDVPLLCKLGRSVSRLYCIHWR